jgi:cyclohexyl-isocyanide hydratase
MDASDKTLTVGFPLYTGSTLLDFSGATQVFSFAPGFRCVWLAPTLDPIRTSESVEVLPQATFDDAPEIDILFIPGGGPEVGDVMQDPVFVDFVRQAGSAARLAGAVCTGSFILAAAGLLDGYKATTYWSQLENLKLFPKLRVEDGYPRWVIDRNRFSGGGISSSIDLALELVNHLSGRTASQTAQLSIQYAPCPPFQSGDPSQAPPEVTDSVRAAQAPFISALREATLGVISGWVA